MLTLPKGMVLRFRLKKLMLQALLGRHSIVRITLDLYRKPGASHEMKLVSISPRVLIAISIQSHTTMERVST